MRVTRQDSESLSPSFRHSSLRGAPHNALSHYRVQRHGTIVCASPFAGAHTINLLTRDTGHLYRFSFVIVLGCSAASPAALDNQVGIRLMCDQRCIVSDGLPDNRTGTFPNSGNPSSIQSQNMRLCIVPCQKETPSQVSLCAGRSAGHLMVCGFGLACRTFKMVQTDVGLVAIAALGGISSVLVRASYSAWALTTRMSTSVVCITITV